MDHAVGVKDIGDGFAAFFDGGEAEFFVEGADLGEAADVFAEGDGDLDVRGEGFVFGGRWLDYY